MRWAVFLIFAVIGIVFDAGFGDVLQRFLEAANVNALQLAYEVIAAGGTAGAIFNAANEAAVEAFLAGSIPFGMITELVSEVLRSLRATPITSLADVIAADEAARMEVQRRLAPRAKRACDDAAVRSSSSPG